MYNEGDLICRTLESLPAFVDRIYVVDDCSTDETARYLRECARRDDRIVVATHERNRGPGAALVTAYLGALRGDAEIIAKLDGDDQMDPRTLPQLLDPIVDGSADYAKGNRLTSEYYRRGMSRWRLFGNTMLTLMTKLSSGYWQLMDPQNGYTAISRDALIQINPRSIYTYYGYLNDILVKLNVNGMRIVDVSHPAVYGDEVSKIRYRRYIPKVSSLLMRNFCWRLKMKYVVLSFHPLVLLYLFGSIIAAAGAIGGFAWLYQTLVLGGDALLDGVLSAVAFMVGAQLLLFAMLFDMTMETTAPRFNGHGQMTYEEGFEVPAGKSSPSPFVATTTSLLTIPEEK